MADLEDLVYKTVKEASAPLTNREIAKNARLALQQVRGAVARMKKKGLIIPVHNYPKKGLKFKRGVDRPQEWRINEPND
jgi:hypothetical protein